MSRGRMVFLTALVLCATASAFPVQASTLSFEGLALGEHVSDQFLLSDGVTISVVSNGSGPDLGIIFDSFATGTPDTDLEGPPWSVGNLAPSTQLGNLLVIAENDFDGSMDGFVDLPDDERRGGSIFFEFQQPVFSFGFDLIDIEADEFDATAGFVAFFNHDVELFRIGFGDLPTIDPSIVFGNNSANRIFPIALPGSNSGGRIVAGNLQDYVNIIEIDLAGSGAVDNIQINAVPEPGTWGLLGAAMLGLAALRRRLRAAARQ